MGTRLLRTRRLDSAANGPEIHQSHDRRLSKWQVAAFDGTHLSTDTYEEHARRLIERRLGH
jgi:hypothetical protein